MYIYLVTYSYTCKHKHIGIYVYIKCSRKFSHMTYHIANFTGSVEPRFSLLVQKQLLV